MGIIRKGIVYGKTITSYKNPLRKLWNIRKRRGESKEKKWEKENKHANEQT